MISLESNIINAYGNDGRKWLASIDNKLKEITKLYQLQNIEKVAGLSWNCIYFAKSFNQEIVIKIIYSQKEYLAEKNWLKFYANNPYIVKLLDYNDNLQIILLEKIQAVKSLNDIYDFQEKALIYTEFVDSLQAVNNPEDFNDIWQFTQIINTIKTNKICSSILNRAWEYIHEIKLQNNPQYLLHGDLHNLNILRTKTGFKIIDPKSVIGEKGYELAAFNYLTDQEILLSKVEIKQLLNIRINYLAKLNNLKADYLKKWLYVKLVLAICWCVEDNIDAAKFIDLHNKFFD